MRISRSITLITVVAVFAIIMPAFHGDSVSRIEGKMTRSGGEINPVPGFMKGISCGSHVDDVELIRELGANYVRPSIVWRDVEPEILNEGLTVEYVDAHPEVISDYPASWTNADEIVNTLVNNDIRPLIVVGLGYTNALSSIDGEKATPDKLGKDNYLGCIYRHTRAVVRRYKDEVDIWQIENELNEAELTVHFGWRKGEAWGDEDFLTRLLATLRKAVKTEDERAFTTLNFHTDVHENIHRDLPELAGPYHWTETVELWERYLDIIGIDSYPNYYTADPVYGTDVGRRVKRARELVPRKPVIVLETSYPAPRPNETLPDPVNFTEEKQQEFIRNATGSAMREGALGYFHFTLRSKGVSEPPGGYTSEDLEALSTLGPAFRNGDTQALRAFLLTHLDYVRNRLPEVLKAVEGGWGVLRGDATPRPSYHTLRNAFSSFGPAPPLPAETFSIPAVPEDSRNRTVLNLSEYFTDEYSYLAPSAYAIRNVSDPRNVSLFIREDYLVVVSITENWTGRVSVAINCTNAYGLTASSPPLTLNVTEVDDAPIWKSDPPGITLEEDGEYTSDRPLDEYVHDAEDDKTEFRILRTPTGVNASITPDRRLRVLPERDGNGNGSVSVRAYQVTNATLFSDVIIPVEIRPVNDPPTITLISPGNDTLVSELNVTFRWLAQDPEDGPENLTFDLYLGRNEDPSLYSRGIGGDSIEVRGLKDGFAYYWYVTAYDGKNVSENSEGIWTFTAYKDPIPPETVLTGPDNGTTVNTTVTNLTWTSEGPEGTNLSYEIYLGREDGKLRKIVTTRNEWYLSGNLTDGMRYRWRVVPTYGVVRGRCGSGVWEFTLNTSFEAIYDISAEFDVKLLSAFLDQRGNFDLTMVNLGTVPLTIRLNAMGELSDYLDIPDNISLEVGGSGKVSGVLNLRGARAVGPGEYELVIDLNFSSGRKTLALPVVVYSEEGREKVAEEGGAFHRGLAIAIIVVLLIVGKVFHLLWKRREKDEGEGEGDPRSGEELYGGIDK